MPSLIVGPVTISSVAADGIVNFGDALVINPKSASKSYAGAGGGNTGNFLQTGTLISATNTLDTDAFDSNVAGNA
ncbi:spore germination protein gerPF-like protein [Fictibacillus macauensis ZFHKF-1]|uniref:Spore germination protein gerPF-like protein n=1 Tax=Fictibacillus macauensis ZFHKF-1 TaxID=1196324 RepID=I8AGB1_9BACL|nr:spore germination protein [Fictibacillus macauensis]EIT84712.1 spore germination protein gerPF-like protein [Fictibacillus macauensis ZFHKF-1]